MPRPVHFELSVSDPEKAQAFYSKLFDWRFQEFSGDPNMKYWMVTTGPDGEAGINGGMLIRQDGMPPGTTNTMGVPSVDAAVEAIRSAGGTICLEKMPVPGMGWVAYALDLDGNMFGVFEMDSNAK
ncbi:MAG: VOC family protein [Chloroflexi bacterium]|nr:VOC family protein [Chloroflexota bacterium]